MASKCGHLFLNCADYLGEKLAWAFGITTPKYAMYIDEHNERQHEVPYHFQKPFIVIDDSRHGGIETQRRSTKRPKSNRKFEMPLFCRK